MLTANETLAIFRILAKTYEIDVAAGTRFRRRVWDHRVFPSEGWSLESANLQIPSAIGNPFLPV